MMEKYSVDEETYLKEEIRSGYLVSTEMKKIWLEELKLLQVFIGIYEENKLRWQVSGGSLLGAKRHGGFIPWDDDIDVVMPRDDYDKFLDIAEKYLEEPLFLQTPLTDRGRNIGYCLL